MIFFFNFEIFLWQPDTWSNTHGGMFESVMKVSCQIIESCWNKERAPVDTYIMGLATSIRERNDYEEQVHILMVTCALCRNWL